MESLILMMVGVVLGLLTVLGFITIDDKWKWFSKKYAVTPINVKSKSNGVIADMMEITGCYQVKIGSHNGR